MDKSSGGGTGTSFHDPDLGLFVKRVYAGGGEAVLADHERRRRLRSLRLYRQAWTCRSARPAAAVFVLSRGF